MSRLSSITRILRVGVTRPSPCANWLFDWSGARGPGVRLFGARLLDQRQRHRERGPASPAFAGRANRAAHLVHGDRRRMEPEAVAVRLGRKAETKNVLEVLKANTVARVADGNHRV